MFDKILYDKLRTEAHPIIKQFVYLIENHCHEQKRLTFYIKKLDITEQQLAFLTSQKFNISPVDIPKLFLVKKITEKLATTEIRLKELSHQFGFKSPATFTKFIRTTTGFTPSRYRALKCI